MPQLEKGEEKKILLHPLSTKFKGFSVCHPLYDDGVMLNMVGYAIHSSLSTESATATLMLLPKWKGICAKAYMQILREHPENYAI